MTIHSTLNYYGQTVGLTYADMDSFDDLPREQCRQVYGVCFYGDKLVIGYGGHKHDWGLIGGTIEAGESFRQTLDREIREESNMKVLEAQPIGVQKVTSPDGSVIFQLRYWAKVEPYGEFVSDPAGGVTKIKLIDPKDYLTYFDWGEIGQRLIERGATINAGHN